jgi:hypothetical protein
MPEGPARRPGRSAAQSIDDAEHGNSMKNAMALGKIWMQERDVSFRKTRDSRESIAVRFAGRIVPANLDTKTCARAACSSCTSRARRQPTFRTTNDGVNDPVSTAWGHKQGRTAGSFTPSLVQRLRHRRRH